MCSGAVNDVSKEKNHLNYVCPYEWIKVLQRVVMANLVSTAIMSVTTRAD